MRNAIVVTLLALPGIALARDPKVPKPQAHEGHKSADAAKAAAATKADEAKGMAERGKARAEEARADAEEKKAEHAEHAEKAEHGGAPAAADPTGSPVAGAGMVRAVMRGHGRPAADVARAIVLARGDVAHARAEARRGEKERLHAHMRKHAGHAGHEMPIPALREELRRHARRLARLARVRELADAAKDADTVTRADKLIEREQERHERWMGKRAGAAEAPAAPATAPQGGTP